VVIDLGRRVLSRIKDCRRVVISPSLFFMPPLDPVWAGLRLIPLLILAPSNRMRWVVIDREWSGFVGCGRLAGVDYGWVSPMFGPS
jgi:hypothetical protein